MEITIPNFAQYLCQYAQIFRFCTAWDWLEVNPIPNTHYFIECSGLSNFWNVFENWWNRIATYPIQLSNKLIMFGIYYNNRFYKNVNYVIHLAKCYIHRHVYLERNIDFFNFLIVLKSHLDTAKYICTCNGRLDTF